MRTRRGNYAAGERRQAHARQLAVQRKVADRRTTELRREVKQIWTNATAELDSLHREYDARAKELTQLLHEFRVLKARYVKLTDLYNLARRDVLKYDSELRGMQRQRRFDLAHAETQQRRIEELQGELKTHHEAAWAAVMVTDMANWRQQPKE